MPTLQELTERVQRVASGQAASTRPVTLDLGEAGLIHIADGVVDHEDGPVDCRVSLTAERLEAMMDGRLDPTMAYMMGQIAVTGDMGLAMQLSGALRKG